MKGTIHIPKIANGKNPRPVIWEEDQNGCHICISHTANDKNYPRIRRKMKQVALMRVIYEMVKGPIPSGMLLRHSCDNPKCINIDHLSVGTTADNNRDRHLKGRDARMLGSDNGNSTLTSDNVKDILANPHLSLAHFAKKYSVYKSTIAQIRKRKAWKHIELV